MPQILSRIRALSLAPFRPEGVTLSCGLFFLLFCNVSFWNRLLTVQPINAANFPGLAAIFIFLLLSFNLLLTLLAWPFVLRPALTLMLLATAFATYFTNQYGVMIDSNMIRNVMETDLPETRDLLTLKMAAYVFLLAGLPIWLLWRAPIHWRPVKRELLAKLITIALSLALLTLIALIYYQTFASIARNQRELRFLLAPTNYLQAVSSYLKSRAAPSSAILTPVAGDARLGAAWAQHPRKSLTVIVVGEAARADHFSLNGYDRETNPQLSRIPGLISLDNVWSCGTETAVSVPCMFSDLGRPAFSRAKAQQRENLLDVLQRTGLAVLWRENQSGCKEVCDRVPKEFLRESADGVSCGPEGCFDEALLEHLDKQLDQLKQDTVLVLHMMGNHGPAYYKRYPNRFEVFLPVCRTSQLDQCAQQEIVNAYDNALRYTDAVLAHLIATLRQRADQVDTAMIYVSDHGQSLGEHHLYLHGTPYLIAPDAQKHIPMLLWFSDGYRKNFGIDTACLERQRHQAFSHDNLFHSVLGLLNVQTRSYEAGQDIFRSCRRG